MASPQASSSLTYSGTGDAVGLKCMSPGREVNRAAIRFPAGIDCLLNGRTGVVGFASRGAVVLDVKDRLGSEPSDPNQQCRWKTELH